MRSWLLIAVLALGALFGCTPPREPNHGHPQPVMTPTPEPVHWFRITRPSRENELLKVVGYIRVYAKDGCVTITSDAPFIAADTKFHECGVGVTNISNPNKVSIEAEQRPATPQPEPPKPLEKP